MDVVRWEREPVEALSAGIGRQMVNTERLTLARILLAEGAVVPEHAHENEQISTVLDGTVRFVVDGDETVLHAGESIVLEANVPHRVEAVTDAIAFDLFVPRREDWIAGDDAYLRG